MTLLYAIGGLAALVILLVLLVLSRIKVAGPNQAFLVTGRQGRQITDAAGVVSRDSSGQKVVMGASVFVLPVVQKLHTMDLSSRRIPVGIRGAVSKQGVKCDLEGVAIVKVGGTEDSIRAAAQRFLNQQEGIDTFTSEVLAGALRSIVGRLTIEEIIRDRAAFASAVAEEAESSLTGQGLVLDTFQLQDIQAEGSYLADLGRPEAARVLKEASIAEARARQAAQQEQLLADEAIGGRPAAAGAAPGRDHRRDRRREGPRRRGRAARPGRAGPGRAHGAGEGRRADGVADRAAAGHPGAPPRRRAAVQGRAGGGGPQELGDPHRRGAAAGDDRRGPGRRRAGEALR
ncbi:flotillin family protein [Blastococcus sp. TML/C7B]|uniref:flotillin family protein n=1 Tax=Blastococcus sp. TML/C7B TaxID=2798728 RepID=UPI00190A0622|nr:flotillin family protein [Blastococcus sp. TML/C7B]MBN1095473.1 flotillin family protein [Blastococcus sp. TML/C7B]